MNMLKVVNFSELVEYDKSKILEELNADIFNILLQKYDLFEELKNGNFKFKFVGILIIDNSVINVYPKYFPNQNYIKEEFK